MLYPVIPILHKMKYNITKKLLDLMSCTQMCLMEEKLGQMKGQETPEKKSNKKIFQFKKKLLKVYNFEKSQDKYDHCI